MQLIARISALERRHETLLAALPTAFQQQFHARHKQAAAEPGQNLSGKLFSVAVLPAHQQQGRADLLHHKCTGAEKWVFPDPILDEAAYRAEHGGQVM
jgi:hypothetical protein